MSSLLRTDELCVAIERRLILRDLSFEAEPGMWLGVLGANGSGKTTLLRCLSGQLEPCGGRITLLGADVTRSSARRALTIGASPAIDALPTLLRGRELLALLGSVRGASAMEPRSVYEALALDSLLDWRIGEMSAGMRQRLAVFTAFVGGPPIVLLDEPFNWLDPVAAFDLKRALRDLADTGVGIVTALHDVATLATRCDAGLVLHEGRIVERLGQSELSSAAKDVGDFELRVYARFKARAHGG